MTNQILCSLEILCSLRMQWVESSGLSKSCVELSPLKTMTIVPPSDEYESLSPTYSVWYYFKIRLVFDCFGY
jgi:hypothetical protein